jgi:leucyl aminopeptidase
VLKSLSGQTIEVINTDAEGRLILADALTLAGEYRPAAIIDAATLTGACVIALGEKCGGLLSNDPDLSEALKKAGDAAGERVWPLPLIEDYEEALKSEVADFKHVGGRPAGAITAALFLRKFVGDTPWAPLDIAGPARTDKAAPDTPQGATGFGIHLLLHYLRD